MMIKRLFILLSTFLFITILQEKIKFRITAAISSTCTNSSQCIVLTLDGSGISIPASFFLKNTNQPQFLVSDETENTEAQRMLINLYTSTTMVVVNCQAFIPLDCQRYSCEEYPNSPRTILHPYFIATGYDIEVNMSLSSDNWKLNRDAMTILSTSCVRGILNSYGAGTYGAIGLGFEGASWKNFLSLSPIFSISLYQDNSGGELWFNRNLDKATSTTPSAVLAADNGLHVENIQAIGVGSTTTPLNDTNLIFDPNMEEIGFPLKIYKALVQTLNKQDVPIRCEDPTQIFYRATCTYHGELKNLPNLLIYAGDQQILIPPWIYILNPETYDNANGSLTLNIKGTHNVTHLPEIHVIEEYKNFIILGRSFMRYYYTVFDGTDHMQNKTHIELYVAKPFSLDDSSNGVKIWIIIISAVVPVLITALVCYVRWRKKKNRRASSSSVNHSRHNEGGQDQEPPAGPQNEDETSLRVDDDLHPGIDHNNDRSSNIGNLNALSINNPYSNNDGEGGVNFWQPLLPEKR